MATAKLSPERPRGEVLADNLVPLQQVGEELYMEGMGPAPSVEGHL